MKSRYTKEYLIYIFSLIFFAWLLWSWWDVLAHQLTPEYPSKANAFRILLAISKYIHS